MTENKRDDLMRPISVSVSPGMAELLQQRAQERTPENPNVSAYVRKLIFQDLEGLVLDRSRALWIYQELERVQGFLDNLGLFDAIPKKVVGQAEDYCLVVKNVRDTIWRVAAAEPKAPAGAAGSGPVTAGQEAADALKGVDTDQLAKTVSPAKAASSASGRKGRKGAGEASKHARRMIADRLKRRSGPR